MATAVRWSGVDVQADRGQIVVSPALPRSNWRLARGRPAPRLFLDRTRLSDSCRAEAHRLLRRRLFYPDLDRHGPVWPRDLDATLRSLHCRLQHFRPLRADGGSHAAEARTDPAAVGCRTPRRPQRLGVNYGFRAPAVVHGSL